MNNFKRLIIILTAGLFIFILLGGQDAVSQGNRDVLEYIGQKLRTYCETVPREEIFIHTDREEYFSGEDLWFTAYVVDRQSSAPSNSDKIVYFELLNPENKPVLQKRIYTTSGSGPGQIKLPDTLSTGTYTIRAYTNWMKNFLPINCFLKDIDIYNASVNRFFKKRIYGDSELKEISGIDSDNLMAYTLPGLRVNKQNMDTLGIIVSSDEKFRSGNKNLFYLFIQTRGNINYTGAEMIYEDHKRINVPRNLIPPGINQITLFDSGGKPVAERYIYTPGEKTPEIEIQSADSFNLRSNVALGIDIGNAFSVKDESALVSISVTPLDSGKSTMGLNEYMIFGSEFGLLPGKVLNGRKISDLPDELTDSLLSVIKSFWIDWKMILSGQMPDLKYQNESDYHNLSGILLTKDNKPATPGEVLLMSVPGKVPEFQYSITDYESRFSFDLPLSENTQDLIIQTEDTTGKYRIYPESSFSAQYLPFELQINSIRKPLSSFISRMGLNYQVGKIYGSSTSKPSALNHPASPPASRRFYGKPDAQIIMKDWSKLPTMEEVFFELVPSIKLKKRELTWEISVTDPLGNLLYDTAPVMMIDGVIIKDPATLAKLDPDYVEKIDVIKDQYMVGDYVFNGIVNLITNLGDFTNIKLPDNSVRMQYRVFDPVREFEMPEYSSQEMKTKRVPDLRNTMYWTPRIRVDKNKTAEIDFWTSDIPGIYEINIQGSTSDGKLISTRKIIKVK